MNEELDTILDMVARLLEFISNNAFWLVILIPLFFTDKKSKVKKSVKTTRYTPTKSNVVNVYDTVVNDLEDDAVDEEDNEAFESVTEEVNAIETYEIEDNLPMSQEIDEAELFSQEEWQQLSHNTTTVTYKPKRKQLKQMLLHHEILSEPKGLE